MRQKAGVILRAIRMWTVNKVGYIIKSYSGQNDHKGHIIIMINICYLSSNPYWRHFAKLG